MAYRPSQPYKLDDQKVLSTENTTYQLVRLYEDWQEDKKTQRNFQDQIELFLSGLNLESLPQEINAGYYIIQKSIDALELALNSEMRFYLSELNLKMTDFNEHVERSKFRRIKDDIKLRGKLNLIALFQVIYHEMKAINQGLAAQVKLRFIYGFLDIAIDAREIYDAGLGREVRHPQNIEKFIEHQQEPTAELNESNEQSKPKSKAI